MAAEILRGDAAASQEILGSTFEVRRVMFCELLCGDHFVEWYEAADLRRDLHGQRARVPEVDGVSGMSSDVDARLRQHEAVVVDLTNLQLRLL